MSLTKRQRWTIRAGVGVLALAGLAWLAYPHLINLLIPAAHRPEPIDFPVQRVSDAQFEHIARGLVESSAPHVSVDSQPQNQAVYAAVARQLAGKVTSFGRRAGLAHIDRFRKAGIREYRGPETCLQCHRTMRVPDGNGGYRTVDTRADVEHSVHFGLNHFHGFTTWGFNGQKVDGIPVGKIDRACGVPGSFTWTGWAVLVKTKTGETRSDGCGQCHTVGQYGPQTGTMFPGYRPVEAEFEATDCLICHAADYDMNQKYVVKDANGRLRWNQDRSMKAAMSVGVPSADACLRCHEHAHGGDLYAGNLAAKALGYKNQRLLHPGAKRGTPDRDYDVHYRAGLQCLDCHKSHGHKIPRGTQGTDLVANDLPGVDVSCTQCHGRAPHVQNKTTRAFLNAHIDKLACTTCHVSHLVDDNVVLRDWTKPVYDSAEGIWLYDDVLKSGEPGVAITYRWFNGKGTFMAGALGDNPNGLNLYHAFTTKPDSQFTSFDYAGYYEKTFRPIADMGTSKIAPFKRFNAKMYEDMDNQGPFGGMLLPFDYNVYYETGDPKASVARAMQDPIIKLMYGSAFKLYMMDDFMHYMGIDKGWTIPFRGHIGARWMRQDGTLMLSHGVTKNALQCRQCHAPKGIMPFEALGYSAQRAADLRNLKELNMIPYADGGRGGPKAGTRTATSAAHPEALHRRSAARPSAGRDRGPGPRHGQGGPPPSR